MNVDSDPSIDPSLLETMRAIKLEIKKDGTFSYTESGFGFGGSLSLGSDTGTLHIQTMLGRRIETLGESAKSIKRERRVELKKSGDIRVETSTGELITLKRIKS